MYVQNMWLWHFKLVYHTEHATFNLQSEPLLITSRAGGGWIRIKDINFEMRCSVHTGRYLPKALPSIACVRGL